MKRTLFLLPRILFGAVVVVAGCDVNSICLNCELGTAGRDFSVAVDGGDASVPPDLAGTDIDVPPPDLLGPADLSCDPTRLATDPNNCGQCGNACSRQHAIPACVGGQCQVQQCDVGYVDLDGNPANDCEYACLATGPEVCDREDNDCNGQTDETFDLTVDPDNCGQCGNVCAYPNATPTCVGGACQQEGCDPGYRDLNPTEPGCEYRCPVYPQQTREFCNGLDDDCDGQIDEATDLEAAPTNLCVTRAGTPCAGTVARCEQRGGVTTWYCNYGAGVEFDPSLPNGIAAEESLCDGLDNECDGQVDDSFASLGGTCDNGQRGACRDVGVVICDVADRSRTVCDLRVLPDAQPGAPSAETCDNLDDDCDGIVDNTTGPGRVLQDMVHVVVGALDFYVDRYEASRPDATEASAGVATGRSCSKGDVLPWTRVSFATAQAACQAAGFRLCTAAEWQAACTGAAGNAYPYGASYQGNRCNGVDFNASAVLRPTGAPALAQCLSQDGVRDLSGNAREWTNDQQGMTTGTPPTPIYVVRGGGYSSPELGLTCGTTFSRASADTTLDTLGFRCCSSTPP